MSVSESLWHYHWRSVIISVSVSVSKIIRYYYWYQYEMLSTLYCSQPRVAMFTIFHAYHTTWDYHICIILKVWWHLTQESVEPRFSTYRSGVESRCGFYSEIVNRVLMSWKRWCCWKYECCLSLWSRWMVQYQIGYFIVRKLKSSQFMAFTLKRVWILKSFTKYEILEDFGKYPLQLLSQEIWQESMW